MLDENPPNPPGMFSDFTFKEIITAAIALAIVASLITMLWICFVQTEKITDDEKFIIGIILSLAGTVTGYYFGRVPAEKRADTAERGSGHCEGRAGKGGRQGRGCQEDARQNPSRAIGCTISRHQRTGSDAKERRTSGSRGSEAAAVTYPRTAGHRYTIPTGSRRVSTAR